MKTLKCNRYPFTLRYEQTLMKTSPTKRSLSVFAKELGIKLIFVDIPDNETYIVYNTMENFPMGLLHGMVQVYANQFDHKSVIESGFFIDLMEEISDGEK